MTFKSFVALMLLLPAVSLAQGTASGTPDRDFREGVSRLPELSPFSHLASETFAKAAAPLPFICPYFLYYQNDFSATSYYHSETLPATSEWAVFIPKPAPVTQASVCTVWTVKLDFELSNAPFTAKDTIRIFVRKGTSPYTQYFTTYFIARLGRNVGFFEIDLPPAPPYGVRAIINPITSLFVGMQVRGDTGHVVKFRFTTPSQYTGTGHSFKFTSPTTIVSASTALGISADFVLEARLCCDKWIPVELSSFNAYAEENRVHLRWRTETETNNFQFEVQRAASLNGPWESRGYVPGSGTTTEPRDYAWEDGFTMEDMASGIAPIYFYKLRQTDFDGTIYDYAPIEVHMTDLSKTAFELSAAYPNPLDLAVTDNVRFQYRVPQQSHVRISVHDMLGRELAVLTDYAHAAGTHETAWYPGNDVLRSGNYFVRMQAEGKMFTRKVAVLR